VCIGVSGWNWIIDLGRDSFHKEVLVAGVGGVAGMTREILTITQNGGPDVEAYYDPNYKDKCEVCGQKPVVRIRKAADDSIFYDGSMCGACTWGEADCLDPANW